MAIDRRPSDPNVLGNQYDVTSLVFPNDLVICVTKKIMLPSTSMYQVHRK